MAHTSGSDFPVGWYQISLETAVTDLDQFRVGLSNMLSKTYHLKFPSLDAAQIAAPFVVETLGNAIPTCNLTGLNVVISKEGDVSINLFFPNINDLKAFEKKHGGFLDTMKKTFLFRSNGFDGVCIFNFDRSEEAA
jgi:hypothetical protein